MSTSQVTDMLRAGRFHLENDRMVEYFEVCQICKGKIFSRGEQHILPVAGHGEIAYLPIVFTTEDIRTTHCACCGYREPSVVIGIYLRLERADG